MLVVRHEDIKKLEEGITEIYSIFMELAIIVDQRGKALTMFENRIWNHICEFVIARAIVSSNIFG